MNNINHKIAVDNRNIQNYNGTNDNRPKIRINRKLHELYRHSKLKIKLVQILHTELMFRNYKNYYRNMLEEATNYIK